MEYLHWDEQTITDLSDENVAAMYARGYVFTRKGKGIMHQTRSARIDLSKFELSSENRRILKKVEGIALAPKTLPLADYNWKLGKTAKDLYDMKFGPGIMSSQKIKEMLTSVDKSNFNTLLTYSKDGAELGYSICYKSGSAGDATVLHYSYPFYHIDMSPKDMGLGMMTLAIAYAKEAGLQYVYLGSLQRLGDVYKLQFSGFEWFDGGTGGGGTWTMDTEKAKEVLARRN